MSLPDVAEALKTLDQLEAHVDEISLGDDRRYTVDRAIKDLRSVLLRKLRSEEAEAAAWLGIDERIRAYGRRYSI